MMFFNFTLSRFAVTAVLFFLFSSLPHPANSTPHKNHFPLFAAIEDNVHFWEKVYSTYSVNTAVLHDKEDLAIIYEIIPLLDKKLPGARRINRSYLKKIKKNYSTILLNLAAGKKPATQKEQDIYNLFSPPGISKKLRRASKNLRVQTGLKERFREGVIRSGAHMEKMKSIFRSYGLPEDLAYLPHVESSFNVEAHSKSGAVGLWQFTRSTGKEFMKIDYTVDERRDSFIATHAAARYLKKSFEKLSTWPLAITAYNYGQSGMRRAVADQGNYEKIFQNYRKGRFKFASRNFYSEFLAARNVAKIMEASAGLKKHKPRHCLDFKLRGYAHIDDVRRHFKLSVKTLKYYNPSLRSPVWKGEKYIPKGYLLQLPHYKTTGELARIFPKKLLHRHQKRSEFYKVRRGDTAGKIARNHGVSLKSLRIANNLNNRSAVYTGQTLRIPSTSSRRPAATQADRPGRIGGSKNRLPILAEGKKNSPS